MFSEFKVDGVILRTRDFTSFAKPCRNGITCRLIIDIDNANESLSLLGNAQSVYCILMHTQNILV